MTVSLGGIALSEHLILTGDLTAQKIVVNKRRFIGGDAHITTSSVSGGDELSLTGENHFTRAQIVAVKALEAVGAPVSLIHHTGTYSVIITGTQVDPSWAYADPASDDWYSGEISMIRVD